MSPKIIKTLVCLLIFLNLMDLGLTLYIVSRDLGIEVNPVMNYFLQMGYFPFILVKLASLTFASVIFWKFRDVQLANICLSVSVGIYIGLNLYFCNVFL